MTNGQVPAVASELLTVMSASIVQLSSMEVMPASASSPATVVSAAGMVAAPASQPSTVISVGAPVKTGT